MQIYKTPGVYVEEISTLPPSVAEVSTAVPAFLGYTQTGPAVGQVSTMLEFEALFGGAVATEFLVNTVTDQATDLTAIKDIGPEKSPNPDRLLYYAISHYFKNGGGPCYVLSVGNYSKSVAASDFTDALDRLALEDEPTLIVLTDAVLLAAADYFAVAQAALAQCALLKDRFLILDVPPASPGAAGQSPSSGVDQFRNGIGEKNLSYGAAYHPYLLTSLTFAYTEDQVQVNSPDGKTSQKLSDLQLTQTALYNQIKDAMTRQRIVLPPSAAVAGIYASVDRDRGVWKAPANVSVGAVIAASTKISDAIQDGLNVDPTAGKSINAIRDFTGKGTLVWGARTLAGNDNEWRYVPVRRLFITIEENTRKASAFAVFEPNDATTWLKVRGMIESYLYSLWERGALAGSTPDSAYYVHVGLGKTMTTQDVLEGRMIVEIGIAAVRPAEFVVIRFMHKLQQA